MSASKNACSAATGLLELVRMPCLTGACPAGHVVHPRLSERRVSVERISALKQKTDDLAGLLAERASAKGEGKSSTQVTYDAVSRQREIWAGAYRILSALGHKDERVRSMLKEAKR